VKSVLRAIDFISDQTGKIACWLAVVLVALISYEVTLRYVFNAPTIWNFETSLMAGATMMAFGWAYAHRHHHHIRVDVFYSRLSPRARAGIDVFGTLLFFFPLIFTFVRTSILWAKDAWMNHLVSNLTYWYPPLAPFRTVVALAFLLLAIQGVAQFIRDFYRLIRNKSYD